jgi:phosphate transport system substrate-binding protein
MNRSFSFRKGGHVGLLLIGLVVLAAAFCCGCIGNQDQTPAASGTSGEVQTIAVTGSTTVLPVAQLAADEYMRTHTDADIQVSGGGSSVGVQAIGEGTADIGMASRDLKSAESEKYPNLVKHVVAIDGIAVIVNPANTVSSLSLDQIRGIYNGTITNWNQVGGSDQEIVVVGRDSASGTREYFSEFVMEKEDFVSTQIEKNSNGAVQQTVQHTPGAIGYVGLAYVDETVKAVSIDSDGTLTEATLENVKAGTYPISRELYMFTQGEPTGLANDYIAFILSSDGQAIVEEEGFVRVN